jgi:hypothetical protein
LPRHPSMEREATVFDQGIFNASAKPQISPLRLASVEMTILWRDEIPRFQERSAELQIPRLPPDFLSRVAASVKCMWFSLGRTT